MLEGLVQQSNPWWGSSGALPSPLPPRRRSFQERIVQHLTREPRRALVVRGPRQVGKSTALRQSIAELLQKVSPDSITFFDFSDSRIAPGTVGPERVAEIVPPGYVAGSPRLLFFDEVGNAREWSRWLKQAVDEERFRIVVTDSSSLDLQQATRESGVGRWDELLVETLTYREFLELQSQRGESTAATARRLQDPFARFLAKGGFPEALSIESNSQWWRRLREDTADRAIGRDLRYRGEVHDSVRVTLLFRYLVEASGLAFDSKKIGERFRDDGSEADPRTVRKWLELLEGTMLIHRLERRGKTPGKRLTGRQRPKLYASDHALLFAFSSAVKPLDDPDECGRAHEAMVFHHLRGPAREHDWRLTFHRSEDEDEEIDFVVEGTDVLTAVEVTHSRDPRSSKIDALARRAAGLDIRSPLIVYGGFTERMVRGVRLVPIRDFIVRPEEWVRA